jgi:hypothetical protein
MVAVIDFFFLEEEEKGEEEGGEGEETEWPAALRWS